MNSFALFISYLFEPMVVIYVLALLGGLNAKLVGTSFFVYLMSVSILVGSVVLMRLFFAKKDHTNWDVSERKKRIMPLLFLSVFVFIQYVLVRSFGNEVLTSLFFTLFIWNIGFFLITLKIKLSGHLSILTLAVGQLIVWYGNGALWLVLLIPLLSWSRVYLKRHTTGEVIAGICYSIIVFLWLN